MKGWIGCSLTRRIMGTIAISLIVSAWILGKRAETLHHETIFQQVRKQSLMFLQGLEREILGLPNAKDGDMLHKLLDRGMQLRNDSSDFSIIQLRVFDSEGNSVASAHHGGHPSKTAPRARGMGMEQGLFSGSRSFVGGEIRHHVDPQTGKRPLCANVTETPTSL